jgi:peptidoglycan/xylan/chitin deacetylase (PgdA/CDA1 family)
MHLTQSIKARIGAGIFGARVHTVLLRQSAVVIAFHRVDDRLKGNPIGCTLREFRRFCDFFKRHFDVVRTGEIVNRLNTGDDISGLLSITFDDGYLDNYLNAAPELEARGLPATFFISTGMIGSNTQPWWDREYGARASWMTWEQVRSLHRRGFEIGTHTVNHVDLGKVDAPTAAYEIRASKRRLEAELKSRVRLFAYPYGRKHQITEENRQIVKAEGLESCFSCHGGLIQRGDDPFRLHRMPINNWVISPEHLGFELLFRK